jgi:hypothetical protein
MMTVQTYLIFGVPTLFLLVGILIYGYIRMEARRMVPRAKSSTVDR